MPALTPSGHGVETRPGDDIEPVSHSGWSVVVVGTAREVSDPDDVEELAHANIPRWAPSTSERVVEVSTELVTGRRIYPPTT